MKRHTSIAFLSACFEWGFLALRGSLGVGILIPLIRFTQQFLQLLAEPVFPAHVDQGPWRVLEITLNPKADLVPIPEKSKAKGKRSISKPLLCI